MEKKKSFLYITLGTVNTQVLCICFCTPVLGYTGYEMMGNFPHNRPV